MGGGSRSKEAKETGSSPTGGEIGKSGGKSSKSESPEEKSKDGAAPKITDHDVPGSGNSKAKQAEVEQHVGVGKLVKLYSDISTHSEMHGSNANAFCLLE